ncbi:hypothetical protein E2C01_001782 [Portunus trituberculatus]|uniref:Uncharacterized protein n=1 Tax=Portunus trituberculatus TaxID=210409 RepID=A0A5B7CI68_PORTR|nr:hypothetical protein [Portunus trituberculatus]
MSTVSRTVISPPTPDTPQLQKDAGYLGMCGTVADVIEEEDETAVKSEVKEACVAEAGGEAGEEEELQLEEEDGEASRTSDQITWLSGFQRKYSVMHDLGKGRFR